MTTPDSDPSEGSLTQLEINQHTVQSIISSMEATISSTKGTDSTADPQTELDSHADMAVLGKHSYIFESTGQTCNVKPFSSKLGIASNVLIVDGAAIVYDCPFTQETYILIFRNALYIPTMDNNLLPPFIMRAGNMIVDDVPKKNCKDPSLDNHCIRFEENDLRIPLQLIGTFSYFHTYLPTSQELYDKDKIFLTPDSMDWNPHCLSFEQNERNILNYEGTLSDPSKWTKLSMQIDDNSDKIFEIASISSAKWEESIDTNISSAYHANEDTVTDDHTESMDKYFAEALSIRGEILKIGALIGSTSISNDPCPLFHGPFVMTMDELEHSLADFVSPENMQSAVSTICSTYAGK